MHVLNWLSGVLVGAGGSDLMGYKAAAEQKKKRVRDRIQEVRQELEELMQKNANIPVNKLSDTEMIVDQEYIAHLMKDMETTAKH